MLVVGEGDHIEFKRAGDGPKADTYESICAFLNHTGGELLLGVGDKGELIGLPEKAVDDMMRSIVKTTNDPNQFRPACAVWPEHVVYKGVTSFMCMWLKARPYTGTRATATSASTRQTFS